MEELRVPNLEMPDYQHLDGTGISIRLYDDRISYKVDNKYQVYDREDRNVNFTHVNRQVGTIDKNHVTEINLCFDEDELLYVLMVHSSSNSFVEFQFDLRNLEDAVNTYQKLHIWKYGVGIDSDLLKFKASITKGES